MKGSGAILAGGENKRMDGYPKGKLTLEGERFLDRIYRRMKQVVEDVYISVHEEVPVGLPDPLQVIRDVYPDIRCSMNGVYSLLEKLREPLLILPWDMPFVEVEFLQYLVKSSQNLREEKMGCFFKKENNLQPFPGIYFPSLRPSLKEALEKGNYAMKECLDQRRVKSLPWKGLSIENRSQDNFFENINTTQEYRSLITPNSPSD